MSAPAPVPAGKPWPPYAVPLIGVGLVAAVVAGVVVFGGPSSKLSDGTDVRDPDPNLAEVNPSVQARDLKVGVGEPCPEGARVKAHYTGWTADGNVFDSSRSRNKPIDITLNEQGCILGWVEGIPGMKKGGVRKLVIAPEKAYGSRSQPNIPANSTLTFEIELVGFTRVEGDSAPARPGPEKLADGSAPGADDPALKDIGGGLKVRDLKVGTGVVCPPGATVTAHYTGWLLSGKVFDSSVARGEPTDFSLRQVVKGWQDGIPGMKVGGVRKLVIPPDLAYGAGGRSGIPPNSTLVFEVELIAVK